MKPVIPGELIQNNIFMIRGQKVMLDTDLARLYGVPTYRLNEQVKRNKLRFPIDFMFRLTVQEMAELIANCDRLAKLKHASVAPYAFTEQGVAMLSSVLRSKQAILVNLAIMRTFVKLREVLSTHKELAQKLNELERKVGAHDSAIQMIFEAIKQLMVTTPEPAKRKIGFKGE